MKVNMFIASIHLLGATTKIISPNFDFHELPRKNMSHRDIFTNEMDQIVSTYGLNYRGEKEIQTCFNRLVKEQQQSWNGGNN